MTPATSAIVAAVFIPLVIWRLYSRVRRLVGRQKSRLWRHRLAIVLLPLALALIAVAVGANPLAEAALGAGVAIGIALALWGLRLTRYEASGSEYFYTPNARIGIALSAILIARIGYRVAQLAMAGGFAAGAGAQDITRSPLTLAIVGVIAAYYAAYAAGLLRWRAQAREITRA